MASPRRPSARSESSIILEGVDQDEDLWHGRKSAADTVHHYVAHLEDSSSKGSLGVVQGVIFPCMGNILGVILFLRGPWIVGKAGIIEGFGVGAVCCTCTFLTTLSLSAIATNGKIAGGGAYYLISRSLGPALGAGVGLCFYMANSIGAAMYFMGCVEAWEIAQPDYQIGAIGDLNNVRFTGYIILAFAVLIILGGIKYVSRLGTVFLMVVLFVILCMYVGCLLGPTSSAPPNYEVTLSTGPTDLSWTGPLRKNFAENWKSAWDAEQGAFPSDTTEYSFVNMMGLYFPSVTGIMAGANRSADLKDPATSIPKGTLIAQISTTLIYLSFIFVFGSVAPRETLLNDKFFASTSAFPVKEIVIYGVMASSLGAGLNSLVSGTRLLGAIAMDGTLPILRVFKAAPGKEPRLALFASAALCAASITIGELNAIAPLLTMFFLMCYTCVNMSCTILEGVSDPNWRPTFRYQHWSVSLVAAILCIWMMFAMAPVTAMVAIVFCTIILAYASYNSHNAKWGDGFQGMKFQLAKNILMSLDMKSHTKNWRPQLLLITEATLNDNVGSEVKTVEVHNPELLKLASQLKNGRGFIVLGGICSSKGAKLFSNNGMFMRESMQHQVADGQAAVKELLKQYAIDGFGRIVYTDDFTAGVSDLVQSTGMGAFAPNCLLASWPDNALAESQAGIKRRSQLVQMIQISAIFQKVMMLTKGQSWPDFSDRVQGTIDIWWIVGDGGVLLLLPFLLKKHRVWSGCRTRLFLLADKGDDEEVMRKELDTYVRDFRLKVEVHIKNVEDVVNSPEAAALPPEDPVPNEHVQDDNELGRTSSKTFADKFSTWRARHQLTEATGAIVRTESFTSKGSKRSKGSSDHPTRIESMRSIFTGGKAAEFPREPPNKVVIDYRDVNSLSDPGPGGQSKNVPSVADLNFDLPDKQPASNTTFQRQVSLGRSLFLRDSRQLTATTPCSLDELSLVMELNQLMLEESRTADLVCTNLPDMPAAESAFGYCQLVEAMTKDMKRAFLLRGTSSEVITAFT
eukprot:TRINITY_DN35076_c0_g1_i1.p1 TRINITY_DN35076_c0_g1~~TRINITY_DN35076_c0_g1_i1.p1  ORF type:complete len:1025 (+),score=157.76 TRINITY_DN35076_c0_g1_i1:47-3121(+)